MAIRTYGHEETQVRSGSEWMPLEGDERPNVEAVHCQLCWILNRIYGVAALKSGSDSKN